MALYDLAHGKRAFDNKWRSALSALVVAEASDDTTYPATRGISFGTAGDLELTMYDGEDVTIPSGALVAGIIHPLSLTKVKAGTTAADIVLYW